MHRFLFCLLFVACGSVAPSGPDASTPGLQIELDLQTRHANTTLSFEAAPVDGCVTLDSPDVIEASWSVRDVDAGRVTFCGEGRVLTTRTSVDAGLGAASDQGFAIRTGAVGRFTSMIAWVEGCGLLVTCDASPRLQIPVRFEVRHAPDERVLCSGTVTERDGVTRCEQPRPVPTYSGLTVVAATNWAEPVALTDTVTLYDAPNGVVREALQPEVVGRVVDWFTSTLGPLPYGPSLTVATGPTTWAGFEGPGLIVLNEKLPLLQLPWAEGTTHAFAHEVAHQWAGDATTLSAAADFTLKEALAEYLTARFEAETTTPERVLQTRRFWRRTARSAATAPRPTGVLPFLPLLAGDAMGTGPMMLVQLGDLVGEDTVWAAVKSLLSNTGAIGWSDLQHELEQRSGRSLSVFFERWVFAAGEPEWPTLRASFVEVSDGQWAIDVTQAQLGEPNPLRLQVDVTLEDGATQTVFAEFSLDAPPRTVRLPLQSKPSAFVLDPLQRVVWFPPIPFAPEPPPEHVIL